MILATNKNKFNLYSFLELLIFLNFAGLRDITRFKFPILRFSSGSLKSAPYYAFNYLICNGHFHFALFLHTPPPEKIDTDSMHKQLRENSTAVTSRT